MGLDVSTTHGLDSRWDHRQTHIRTAVRPGASTVQRRPGCRLRRGAVASLRAERARSGRNDTHIGAVSQGRRDTSLIDDVEEAVVAYGDYERLTSEAIEKVWVRLRAGQARQADGRGAGAVHRHGAGVSLAVRRDQMQAASTGTERLSMAEREEISRGLACGRSIRALSGCRVGVRAPRASSFHQPWGSSVVITWHAPGQHEVYLNG